VEYTSRNLYYLIMNQSLYTVRHTMPIQIWYSFFSKISVNVHQTTMCLILQDMFVVVRFGVLKIKRKFLTSWVTIRFSRKHYSWTQLRPKATHTYVE